MLTLQHYIAVNALAPKRFQQVARMYHYNCHLFVN